jgi:hypothetical protein
VSDAGALLAALGGLQGLQECLLQLAGGTEDAAQPLPPGKRYYSYGSDSGIKPDLKATRLHLDLDAPSFRPPPSLRRLQLAFTHVEQFTLTEASGLFRLPLLTALTLIVEKVGAGAEDSSGTAAAEAGGGTLLLFPEAGLQGLPALQRLFLEGFGNEKKLMKRCNMQGGADSDED